MNRQNNNIYAIEQKPCPRIDVIFTMLTECVTSCCQIGGLTWLLDSWIGSSLTFSALMFRMILIWAQSIRSWWHPGRPQAASRQYGLYFAVSFSCQTVTNKNILIWYLYFGHRSTLQRWIDNILESWRVRNDQILRRSLLAWAGCDECDEHYSP